MSFKQNSPLSQQLSASGGQPPYVWSVVDNMPAGLTLSSAGLVSGTPTVIGPSNFTVKATDTNGNFGTKTLTWIFDSDAWEIVLDSYTIPSGNATYFINSPTSVNEGGSITFTVATTGVTGGTTLYWAIFLINGASSEDISTSMQGTVSINSNAGTIPISIASDQFSPESGEAFYLRLYKTQSDRDQLGPGVAASGVVNIVDIVPNSSIAPTPAPIPAAPIAANISVEEGSTLRFRINTAKTSAADLTAYLVVGAPFTTVGADISQSMVPVSIVNRTGTASISIVLDGLTEGLEYFTVWVEYPLGTRKSTFGRVNIVDTSVSPAFSSSISPSTANRGAQVTLQWTTTNAPPGSYVKIEKFNSNTTNDATQYSTTGSKNYSAPTSGGTDGLGAGDWISEIKLYSAAGILLSTATSNYSVSGAQYTITPDKTFLYQGYPVTYQIGTTNIPNGTVLYWKNIGTTTGSNFVDQTNSGSLTINNNAATLVRATKAIGGTTTNVISTISMTLKSGSVDGPTVAVASDVNLSSLLTYTITPDNTVVSEGASVNWDIVTTSVPDGTTLYWTNSGTTSAVDFSGNSNSGTVVINGQTGTISRTLTADQIAEGFETIILNLRSGSVSGNIIATANAVTVSDSGVTVNEIISGPSTSPINQLVTVSITGGIPNTNFNWSGAATGSATLNSSGSATLSNIDFGPYGAGTYNYTFTFSATGHTRSYSIIITPAEYNETVTISPATPYVFESVQYSISGGKANSLVSVSGSHGGSFTLDASGSYTFGPYNTNYISYLYFTTQGSNMFTFAGTGHTRTITVNPQTIPNPLSFNFLGDYISFFKVLSDDGIHGFSTVDDPMYIKIVSPAGIGTQYLAYANSYYPATQGNPIFLEHIGKTVLFSIANFKSQYPSATQIIFEIRGSYYFPTNPTYGLRSIRLDLWTGGSPLKSNNYWTNPTATSTKIYNSSSKGGYTSTSYFGERIAIVKYNLITGVGSVDINDTAVY